MTLYHEPPGTVNRDDFPEVREGLRMKSALYLGYCKLEDFLDAAKLRHGFKTLYASQCIETYGSSHPGMSSRKISVVCAFPDADNCVHYCLLPGALVQLVHGEPFGEDQEVRARIGESLWPLVESLIRLEGFEIVNAIYSTPKDLRMVEGSAQIRIDGDHKIYVYCDEVAA